MEVRVLGPLEVIVDGSTVRIPPGRQRGLLIALLLKPGALVPAERLIDLLWPDGTVPLNARNALQTLIARLRSALGPHGGALRTRHPGYLLDPSRLDIDAARFVERLAEAATTGSPAQRMDRIDAALALWRGPAYCEYAEGFARGEALRLEQLRTQTEESRIELLLSLGRVGEAVAAAQALTAEHPHRDGAVAVLMRSLHAAGRTLEALDAFTGHRDTLREEFGVDPAPALADLHLRLLRHEPADSAPVAPGGGTDRHGGTLDAHTGPGTSGNRAAGAHHRVETPGAREPARDPGRDPGPPRSSRSPVPSRDDSFVGRDDDVRAVRELLAAHRIVTLVGTGGVGKTRLAAQIAAAVPGSYWIELGDLADGGVADDRVASALGLTLTPGTPAADSMSAWAGAAGAALVVLDNCEHLVEAAIQIVRALTGPGSRLRVLATSREALGLTAEAVRQVEPLPAARADSPGDTALRLFFDRARLRAPGIAETPETRAAAARLCRALDGLPLAIELAAARAAALTIEDMLARLPASLEALGSPRGGDRRHGTLRAAIDWSYRLMEPAHRELFTRLAVFNAPFSLADAEAVATGDPITREAVAGGVARLVEQQLLSRPQQAGPGRYRMLRVVRTFARGLPLDEARAATGLRHAEHFARLAQEAQVGLSGADEGAWGRRLEAALPDLHAAFAFAAAGSRWDLCRSIVGGTARWAYHCLHHDLLDLGTVLLERDPGKDLDGSARFAAAGAAWLRGRMEEAERIARSGAEPPAAMADEVRGDVNLLLGRLDIAAACHEAALEACGHDDLPAMAKLLAIRALGYAYSGEEDQAAATVQRAVRTAHTSGSPSALAFTVFAEGEIIGDADPDRALRRIGYARRMAAEVEDLMDDRLALIAEVALRGRHGDPATAFALYRTVLASASEERVGDVLLDTALRNLVPLLARVGAGRDAAVLAGFLAGPAPRAASYGEEADRLDDALRSVSGRLGPDTVAALMDEGQAMTRGQIIELARRASSDR